MSGFPTLDFGLDFGQGEGGLFTPEEVGRLMASEYARSQRYDYPLALFLVEIDRLESLHDLYGVESERRILRAVVSLLRSATRASDVLGSLRDQRLLLLLPHTPRPACRAIAGRLLAGCRELEFRGDGRVLRASLAIGAAARADEGDLARLTANAERALLRAVEAGGNRFVEYESLPSEPHSVRAEVPPPMPARARTSAPAAPTLPAVEELPGSTLEEKVHALFRLAGAGGELGFLEREALSVLQRAVGEARGRSATRAEVQREVGVLAARVERLREMLAASEEELARMIQEKSADPGLASIYRSVQGLDPHEHDHARKQELLALIYQANVELLRQLRGEAGG